LRERDQYGDHALRWKYWLDEHATRIITTEMVLWEVLNALAHPATRSGAAEVYRQCHQADGVEVVPCEIRPMQAAFALYATRRDKSWSLTDCLSFRVMQERKLTDALTADHHFEQAGFRALLLEDPPS
jgi:hypothetical protein